MKLQQLRYIVEVVNHHLNISAATEKLYTSQPGVSKQIKLLEMELGVQIFVRNGKQLADLTPVGEKIVALSREVLAKTGAIKAIANEYTEPMKGTLNLAATYMQVLYELPDMIKTFIQTYPAISLHLTQGSVKQITESITNGEINFAIVTELLPRYDDFIMLPCYHWNQVIVILKDHPLAKKNHITLNDLANYPLVTYHYSDNDNSALYAAFNQVNLKPNVAFSAMDVDMIKTYVRLGLGVGIIAKMAINSKLDHDLVAINAGHLFTYGTVYLLFSRFLYLRYYMYDFIHQFGVHLTQDVVDQAISLASQDNINAMFNGFKLPIK